MGDERFLRAESTIHVHSKRYPTAFRGHPTELPANFQVADGTIERPDVQPVRALERGDGMKAKPQQRQRQADFLLYIKGIRLPAHYAGGAPVRQKKRVAFDVGNQVEKLVACEGQFHRLMNPGMTIETGLVFRQ
jgi:hypothetical protein